MQKKIFKIITAIFLILLAFTLCELFIIDKMLTNRSGSFFNTLSFYIKSPLYARILQPGTNYVLADINGNPVSKTKYTSIVNLKNGFYKVRKKDKIGIIDYMGKTIVPVKYKDVIFINEYFEAKRNSDKYYIYDKTAKLVTVLTSHNNVSPVILDEGYFAVNKNGKFIIVDRKKKNIIKEDYEELIVREFVSPVETLNGKMIFRIKKDGKWGLINIDNVFVLAPQYDAIQMNLINDDASEIFVKKVDKWGIIELNHKIVTDFIYDFEPKFINKELYIVPFIKEEEKYAAKPPLTKEEKIDLKLKQLEEKRKLEETKRLERIKKVDGDLHVVSVYEGMQDYSPNMGLEQHKPVKITVKVEIKNKPITLLLASYDSVLWKIERSSGVQIKKIYFTGYYDSDVKAPKNIKIEKLEKRAYYTEATQHKIKDILDKEPASLQYKYRNDYFLVDGVEGVNKQKNFPSHESTDAQVKFVCKYTHDCVVSKDGLEVGYSNVGASSTAFTNKYYNKGKYYFEAQLIALEKDLSWNNVGIISNDPKRHCMFHHFDEEDSCYPYGFIGREKLKDNDIVGFAADFDNGKIYVSLNGVWNDESMPEKEKTTYFFKNDGREYSAAVEAGRGVKWKVNFGAKKFKYKLPKGFKPYDEYSANKNRVNQIK
ncbi:MAG: WG repeat-containing protein [Candidatus Avigastranaerophilus sp.]